MSNSSAIFTICTFQVYSRSKALGRDQFSQPLSKFHRSPPLQLEELEGIKKWNNNSFFNWNSSDKWFGNFLKIPVISPCLFGIMPQAIYHARTTGPGAGEKGNLTFYTRPLPILSEQWSCRTKVEVVCFDANPSPKNFAKGCTLPGHITNDRLSRCDFTLLKIEGQSHLKMQQENISWSGCLAQSQRPQFGRRWGYPKTHKLLQTNEGCPDQSTVSEEVPSPRAMDPWTRWSRNPKMGSCSLNPDWCILLTSWQQRTWLTSSGSSATATSCFRSCRLNVNTNMHWNRNPIIKVHTLPVTLRSKSEWYVLHIFLQYLRRGKRKANKNPEVRPFCSTLHRVEIIWSLFNKDKFEKWKPFQMLSRRMNCECRNHLCKGFCERMNLKSRNHCQSFQK